MKKHILILFCSFIFITSFTAGNNESKYILMFNKIKSKANPTTFTMLKNSKKKFINKVDILKKDQNYSQIAKRNIFEIKSNLVGIDVSEAAFIVLHLATKDMDYDIGLIMAEIKAMTASKQKLRDLIKDLNKWLSDQMGSSPDNTETNNEQVNRDDPEKLQELNKLEPVLKKHQPILKIKKRTPNFGIEYFSAPKIKIQHQLRGEPKQYLISLQKKYKADLKNINRISKELSQKYKMTIDRRSKFVSTLSQIMKKTSTSQDLLIQNTK